MGNWKDNSYYDKVSTPRPWQRWQLVLRAGTLSIHRAPGDSDTARWRMRFEDRRGCFVINSAELGGDIAEGDHETAKARALRALDRFLDQELTELLDTSREIGAELEYEERDPFDTSGVRAVR